jgi:hypothetical protein
MLIALITTFMVLVSYVDRKFVQIALVFVCIQAPIATFWVVQSIGLYPYVSKHTGQLSELYSSLGWPSSREVGSLTCSMNRRPFPPSEQLAFLLYCDDAQHSWDELSDMFGLRSFWLMDFHGHELPEVTSRPSFVYLFFYLPLVLMVPAPLLLLLNKLRSRESLADRA